MINKQISNFVNMLVAEKGLSQNTVTAYKRDILQFLNLCNKTGFSEKDIEGFVRKLSAEKKNSKKIARKITAIRGVAKFLFSEKELKEKPAGDIVVPKLKKPLPKFLTEEDTERLINFV